MNASRAGRISRPERFGLVLLFLVAFALRAACVLEYTRGHPHAEHLVIDEESYESWALAIAGGEWVGREVFFQEPLYPYCLAFLYALFGHDRLLVRLVQSALGAVTCVLVVLLGRRTFGARAGFLAGVGLALHRPALLLPCLFLKENLFLPLSVLLALLLVSAPNERRARFAWIGLLGGLGALLRGNMLVLLPALASWPLGRELRKRGRWRSALRASVLVIAGAALALLPVAWRNHAVGGVFALTTSGAGTNLYGGNNPESPYGVATELDFVRGVPKYEADDWRREAERRVGRPLDAGEVSRYWTREVWRSVRERPGTHLRILWNKLRLTLGRHEVPDNHSFAWDARYLSILRWPLPGFGVTGSLGLAGLLVFLGGLAHRARSKSRLGEGERAGFELALWFSLYLATIVLTVTSDRARLPLVPVLLPFAGWWLVELAAAIRDRRWRKLAVHCGALGAAALFVLTPVFDRGAAERELAGRDYNLAVQLLEAEGRPDDALPIAESLLARDPSNPRFQTLLASIEWRRGSAARAAGREEEGRALVRSALARAAEVVQSERTGPRDVANASRLAGWIQLELSSYAAAERHFRRAREFAHDDPELVFEHAQALVKLAEHTEPGAERARLRDEAAGLLDVLDPALEPVADLRARIGALAP